VDRETLAVAWVHLRAFPDRPVQLEHFDGRQGFPASAPYDRAMVTASTPDLEAAWLDQLGEHGLLLAPVSFAPGLSFLIRGTVREGVLHGRLTRPAYFMPLRAESESGGETSAQPEPKNGQTLPAPWADWFVKARLRMSWLNFSHALAFYGWLRGLELSFHTDAKSIGFFGVHEAAGGEVGCWLGVQEWRSFGGSAGRDLGWKLWRAFLDAGGPRPTEFRVRVSPRRDLTAADGENYSRQLPRCQWLWELSQARDRQP
jgi:Protein-L-isoaspartate(D-aspartate) O-methyltransferase (PCMT)